MGSSAIASAVLPRIAWRCPPPPPPPPPPLRGIEGRGEADAGRWRTRGADGALALTRPERPKRCTLPMTALRVTPWPSWAEIWLALLPSIHSWRSRSTRSSVQDIRPRLPLGASRRTRPSARDIPVGGILRHRLRRSLTSWDADNARESQIHDISWTHESATPALESRARVERLVFPRFSPTHIAPPRAHMNCLSPIKRLTAAPSEATRREKSSFLWANRRRQRHLTQSRAPSYNSRGPREPSVRAAFLFWAARPPEAKERQSAIRDRSDLRAGRRRLRAR